MTIPAHDLRRSFVDYFVKHGHTAVPSAPLIPQADPTLLFTNAGMNQFKRVFLGEETRPYRRAVSVQKCMRAGGKHNDLENVGYTNRHHTFFEMLGNFSFGDYFKGEAIEFGWEYLTQWVRLPADRLYVTIYLEDDEAQTIWERRIGIPSERIVRLGDKDNFWQMGDTGPCGPCSEILIDQGEALGCGKPTCGVGCDCDRYLEIWNLVFMQYDRDASGKLTPLPKPSIDTGMGLERLAAVAQGVTSNFETDLFRPLLTAIAERTGHRYGTMVNRDRSMRVIADHLRAIAFLIADGILPSNEGRGYVLRRIIRRASRHGRLLGVSTPFLYELVSVVIAQMKSVYAELEQTAEVIGHVLQGEEERFIGTLDQGLPLLNAEIRRAKEQGATMIPGETVFKLYDTYGFPLDLIEEAAREEGMALDHTGYRQALEEQRERARKSAAFTVAAPSPEFSEILQTLPPTSFVGYDRFTEQGVVQTILKDGQAVQETRQGDEVLVVLDVTPFYPEGGGQVGDQGIMTGPAGRLQIFDTTRVGPGIFLHKGRLVEGTLHVGEQVTASVNVKARRDAARNHTATHLVHAALRELLGPHVKQYGSLVAPDRLRFDFAHFRGLSPGDITSVEDLVNEQIQADKVVETQVLPLQEAMSSGALAFFGDKYGDQVRVVQIDSFSKELCGGTHCHHTGEVGVFRIVAECGVAAGVRRIEALTGFQALRHDQQIESRLQELATLLKTGPAEVVDKTKKLLSALKDAEREVERLKVKLIDQELGHALVQTEEIGGVFVQAQRIDGLSMQELRVVSDKLRHTLASGVLVLGSVHAGKVFLLILVTKDLLSRIQAGEIAKCIAPEVNGSGGGRPDMAQAGGNRPEGLDHALKKAFEVIRERLSP